MSKKPSVEPTPDLPVGALSRDQFFAAAATLTLRTERVPCPELKGYLCIGEMDASRKDEWETATTKKVGGEMDRSDLRAKAIALSLWDETRNTWMCTLADVPQIGRMPAKVIQRAFDAFVRINAIRDEDLKELVDAVAKSLSADG